jgi:2-polyprenyl-3-methyl-5-hydroxy-6-metoxy-1,4-benzoquinol methylase
MITTQPRGDRCCFCGGARLRRLAPRNFTTTFGTIPGGARFPVVECADCAVAWRWPIEKVADLGAYYEQVSADALKDDAYFDDDATSFRTAAQADFVAACASRGRVLDIGAGDGSFVARMLDRNWDAYGVEPTQRLVDRARARVSDAITAGTIDDLPPGAVFDAATMWDVIEHVEDPMAVLRKAAERLKPGGWLFIETGNYQSEDRITSGDDWYLWQEDHRWYLAPPVVERMLRTLGFDSITHASQPFRAIKPRERLRPPGALSLAKSVVRKPLRIASLLRQHAELHRASRDWAEWAHIPIFAVAGRLGARAS